MKQDDAATTGIRRRGKKWWVFVKAGGRVYTKTFVRSTPRATMQQWRRRQREIAPRPAFTRREQNLVLGILTDVASHNGYTSDAAVQRFLADVRATLLQITSTE